MSSSLIAHAAETAEHSGGVNPYVIGGIALLVLLALLFVLLSFGKGREHS